MILGAQALGAKPKHWHNDVLYNLILKKRMFQESMHHRYRLKVSIFKVV